MYWVKGAENKFGFQIPSDSLPQAKTYFASFLTVHPFEQPQFASGWAAPPELASTEYNFFLCFTSLMIDKLL